LPEIITDERLSIPREYVIAGIGIPSQWKNPIRIFQLSNPLEKSLSLSLPSQSFFLQI